MGEGSSEERRLMMRDVVRDEEACNGGEDE